VPPGTPPPFSPGEDPRTRRRGLPPHLRPVRVQAPTLSRRPPGRLPVVHPPPRARPAAPERATRPGHVLPPADSAPSVHWTAPIATTGTKEDRPHLLRRRQGRATIAPGASRLRPSAPRPAHAAQRPHAPAQQLLLEVQAHGRVRPTVERGRRLDVSPFEMATPITDQTEMVRVRAHENLRLFAHQTTAPAVNRDWRQHQGFRLAPALRGISRREPRPWPASGCGDGACRDHPERGRTEVHSSIQKSGHVFRLRLPAPCTAGIVVSGCHE